jgi:NAD(P)-dependent dehydrogenase (short-subunit alcohol dehydrogenase family)
MNMQGKVALITGAAVGIGRAVAVRLAQLGAKTVITDIDPEGLDRVRKEIEAFNPDVLSFVCDVREEAQVAQTVKETHQKWGKLDILVNNAGLWKSSEPFTETSTEKWNLYWNVNVMGTVHFTKAALPKMIENGYGRIVNVASVAGVYGNANMTAYSATKGAMIAMTKALAKEVSGKGVLVNSVSPGSVSPSENPDMDYTQESLLSFMGRTGSDNENANLICFLASDEASYISGQNIQIDGCRKKM